MSQESELARLEAFVDKLLNNFNQLRAENARLKSVVASREATIVELRNSLANRDDERGEISNRVNRLLRQIEEWEDGLDGQDDAVVEEAVDEAQTAGEVELVEEDAEVVAEAAAIVEAEVESRPAVEEGRVQHNLFSMSSTR